MSILKDMVSVKLSKMYSNYLTKGYYESKRLGDSISDNFLCDFCNNYLDDLSRRRVFGNAYSLKQIKSVACLNLSGEVDNIETGILIMDSIRYHLRLACIQAMQEVGADWSVASIDERLVMKRRERVTKQAWSQKYGN